MLQTKAGAGECACDLVSCVVCSWEPHLACKEKILKGRIKQKPSFGIY